jgi:diaminohydroxyphosphoribosylaminopyrimidine deaminase/5-amino-6-(5-phosphoribosylamino)uracil reductase
MSALRDEVCMRRALELAERGRGLTSPNPMVGAVVARAGAVVAEGFHRQAGEAHAEVEALAAAGEGARGATLYVTLEPCAHFGRTPPCAPRVAAAGVQRVVAAIVDPDPRVAGRGLALLRRAGVEVTVGILQLEAERQNRAFLTSVRLGRPHITLKAAMTLDGKIADRQGTSQWITGEAARGEAHRLRSEVDAILVGVGTVLADDPALTVRREPPWPREPYRVVLDSRARTPADGRILRGPTPARTLVAVSADAPPDGIARLERAGATVLRVPSRDGRLDLEAVLLELHRREVRALLVEGGAEVHGAFLEAGLVDRVAMFLAPLLLGGRAAPSAIGGGGRPLREALALADLSVRAVGPDLLVEADVAREKA